MKKLLVLLMLVSMLAALFTGCTADEMAVFNAMMKSNEINSMESTTDVSIKFEATGFPEESQQQLMMINSMLGDITLKMNQKMSQNAERTVSKSQVDMTMMLAGMPMDMGVWVDSDLSGDKPVFKEIIKYPEIYAMMMPPEFIGKEYMVIDSADMAGLEGQADFSGMMKSMGNFGLEWQGKLTTFFKDFATDFDPGFNFVTKIEDKVVNGESLPTYRLTLDDKAFKALVKSGMNSLLQDENALKLVEEYIKSVSKMMGEGEDSIDQSEMDQVLKDIEKALPEFIAQANTAIDAFNDTKILGERGIVIDCSINSDGYIVSQSGVIDLELDLKALSEVINTLVPEEDKATEEELAEIAGMINLSIDYNTEISNINGDVKIELPEVNAQNSISFAEMMGEGPTNEEPEKKEVKVRVNGNPVDFDVKPKIVDGRTLVPVRGVFEAIGAEVTWENETRTVKCVKGSKVVTLKIDSVEATVDGEKIILDVPATIDNGRTLVPVRFISESLGAEVGWDAETKTVIITSAQ